jgi:hypothetical protein
MPPAEPVALTVHSVAAPDAAAPEARTRTGRLKMLLVLLVCASPVVASYFTYFVIRPEGRTNHGELIQPSRGMPARLALTDLDGKAVAPRSLRGQWLLVAVGPAACDAACEKRLYTQRQLREMLGRERDRLDKVWLVTDAAPLAPALRAAVQAAPETTVLRADAAAVAQWLAPATGHRIDEHLYVIDPMGEWMMRFPVALEPAKIKRDLDRLLRASNSWDNAGR